MPNTPRPNGAEAVLDILRNYNIEYLFASPGSEWPPLWEQLAQQKAQGRPGPQYLNTRHETLAIGMAMGYAKVTGRLPAVLLHTTVGALHGAMALRAAYHEQVPMVVCAGESVGFGEGGGDYVGFQWQRFLSARGGPARMADPYVKWSFGVNSKVVLPNTVHRACQLAMASPKGPVFLSIPFEHLVEEMVTSTPSSYTLPTAPRADLQSLEKAAWLLTESRNPIIISEYAGQHPEGVRKLVELAELTGAPVVESQGPGFVNFPRAHALHGGFDALPYLKEADLILMLAVVGPWYPPSAGPGPEAKVVVIDENPLRADAPYWGYQTDECIVSEVTSAISDLIDLVKQRVARDEGFIQQRQQRLARWATKNQARRQSWKEAALAAQNQKPINTRWLCHEINHVLPPETIVVEETITSRSTIFQQLESMQPRGYVSGQSGGLGLGMGIALGVKCAAPDKLVVSLIGDGSFNYNPIVPAFGCAQEHHLPTLTILFNNRSYLAMKLGTQQLYPQGWAAQTNTFYGAPITPHPDYAALARAFNGYGELVEDPAQICPALQRAVEVVRGGQAALVDVVLAE
jgi:acetolactate synthase-1/2/3 large subunit